MIRTKSNCAVCKTIKTQPKGTGGRLAKRIYETRWYKPSSSLTVRQLSIEYKDCFSYESLRNHCRKHQFLNEDDFKERHLREISKKAEKTLLKDAIQSVEVFDSVIQRGMANLENGELKIDSKDLLSAAKYKKDFELKEKGQQLAVMEMMFHFMSGEDESLPGGVRRSEHVVEGETTQPDVSGDPESDSERRKAQSLAFYQSLAGDAAAPGAS